MPTLSLFSPGHLPPAPQPSSADEEGPGDSDWLMLIQTSKWGAERVIGKRSSAQGHTGLGRLEETTLGLKV